jgi:hypothetical protein
MWEGGAVWDEGESEMRGVGHCESKGVRGQMFGVGWLRVVRLELGGAIPGCCARFAGALKSEIFKRVESSTSCTSFRASERANLIGMGRLQALRRPASLLNGCPNRDPSREIARKRTNHNGRMRLKVFVARLQKGSYRFPSDSVSIRNRLGPVLVSTWSRFEAGSRGR